MMNRRTKESVMELGDQRPPALLVGLSIGTLLEFH